MKEGIALNIVGTMDVADFEKSPEGCDKLYGGPNYPEFKFYDIFSKEELIKSIPRMNVYGKQRK